MDKRMINQLYEMGKMPERYYNQLNGKSAQENYANWHNGFSIDEDLDISSIQIIVEDRTK